MRLIDAEELKRELKIWCYNRTTTTPTFSFVTEKDIDECPTVCDIEQIRAEIEQLYTIDTVYEEVVAVDKADVLQIIDKYREEQTDDKH